MFRDSAKRTGHPVAAATFSLVTPSCSEVTTSSCEMRIRLEDAKVGDYRLRACTGKAQASPVVTAFAEANGGYKIELAHEGAGRMAEDDQNALGRACDLRGTARAWKACLRSFIRTDHRGVDVSEAVNLGRTEKADVDATGLQPVAEDLRR